MTYPILSQMPVPKVTRTARRRKYPFESMEVGDMFFVPGRATLATYASTAGKKLGRKFRTQLVHMRETIEGWQPCEAGAEGAVRGVGIWRTE